jgi:hypothetical protein
MKCITCEQKLNIKNIHRLCKSDDTHVYCKDCVNNIIKNEYPGADTILCKKCDSIIFKKTNSNDSQFDEFKILLNTFLLGAHISTISNQIN